MDSVRERREFEQWWLKEGRRVRQLNEKSMTRMAWEIWQARGDSERAAGQADDRERWKAAAIKLLDYCEAHDWGLMPEPYDSVNDLLELVGRAAIRSGKTGEGQA